MFDQEQSLFAKNISPFIQAAFVLGLILVFNLLGKMFSAMGVGLIKEGSPWLIFTAFLLFFSLINSVLSISAPSQNKYWLHSIISFVSLGICGGVVAYLFSGLHMDEAGSYRWIIFVFTLGYIIFLSMVRTMKKIVTLAQKQDKRLRGEE